MFTVCTQSPREGADPFDDRPHNLRHVVPHLDVLKSERISVPQAPDELRCAADDPARDRDTGGGAEIN